LILLLLLGILLETISYQEEKPILLTLIDSSASMKNYKDSTSISKDIENLTASINSKFSDKYALNTLTIGEKFGKRKGKLFTENQSNLQLGFEDIASQYYNRNIGAVVFISDGNYNQGVNPIYAAKNIPLAPIFTIGVGDTLPKKDQAIQNVSSNDFAFLHAKFPVEIDLEAVKLQNQSSTVSILHQGKVIASKKINYTGKANDYKHITFELEANKIGFQQYTIQLSALNNEYTYKNNVTSFYIEIIDNRNKVLFIAGAPHPDVTALKTTLEKDENMQVQIANSTQWKEEYASADLVIWHEPGVDFSSNTFEKLKTLKKPIFFFIGPNTPSNILNQLNLGFNSFSNKQTEEVQASVAQNVNVFEMPTDISKEIGFFPPVFVKYGDLNFTKDMDILLYQKLGTIVKKEPLLFFGNRIEGNFGVFYGEGIWKWKFYEYSKSKDTKVVDQLFQKAFAYLLVKQNKSALHITLPRKFSSKEEVRIKAEFYNPSMELITTPSIQLELTNENKKKSNYQFGVTSNFYTLPLGTLAAGSYSWKASTVFNGKIHQKQGTFIVENQIIEQLDTKANHLLLRQIAANSNGKFFRLKNAEVLIPTIEAREDIASVSFEQKSTHNLLDYVWILILIIGLFGTEWFIKKWFGGY
jgi:G:T/U-mismatch repair DNA glycosylase